MMEWRGKRLCLVIFSDFPLHKNSPLTKYGRQPLPHVLKMNDELKEAAVATQKNDHSVPATSVNEVRKEDFTNGVMKRLVR